ncbi:MAG: alpha/beta hydrolase [Clostridia bacterium]|nr:alpha/beta hydrolase [Clostridia bacterium]
MGIVVKLYKDSILRRYDKDCAIPYYSGNDFEGLRFEEESFTNSEGVEIRYFTYFYEGFRTDRLILFCPGIGPGHTAYLSEIEAICREGFRVLTLDYTGCGASGGEKLSSVNASVRDAMELLGLVKPAVEVIPVGHSLGGYTALTVANLSNEVKRAAVISGFVSISDEMMGFAKLRFLANRVKRFEEKNSPAYGKVDNRAYLAETQDRILWIHSTDDPMVNYKYNAGQVLKLNNPGVEVVTVHNKRHNPQYTGEALAAMNAWIGEYGKLVREKKLATVEERQAFFEGKPVSRMTELDPEVFGRVLKFIGE